MTITRAACGPIRWQHGVTWHSAGLWLVRLLTRSYADCSRDQCHPAVVVVLYYRVSRTTINWQNRYITAFHQRTILRKSRYWCIIIERILWLSLLNWQLNKFSPLTKMFGFVWLKSVGGSMWTLDKCPEILKAKILKNVVAGFRVFHQVELGWVSVCSVVVCRWWRW